MSRIGVNLTLAARGHHQHSRDDQVEKHPVWQAFWL